MRVAGSTNHARRCASAASAYFRSPVILNAAPRAPTPRASLHHRPAVPAEGVGVRPSVAVDVRQAVRLRGVGPRVVGLREVVVEAAGALLCPEGGDRDRRLLEERVGDPEDALAVGLGDVHEGRGRTWRPRERRRAGAQAEDEQPAEQTDRRASSSQPRHAGRASIGGPAAGDCDSGRKRVCLLMPRVSTRDPPGEPTPAVNPIRVQADGLEDFMKHRSVFVALALSSRRCGRIGLRAGRLAAALQRQDPRRLGAAERHRAVHRRRRRHRRQRRSWTRRTASSARRRSSATSSSSTRRSSTRR